MHTETSEVAPVVLFLFAHQDDEFGVFHLIEACRRDGVRPICVYFTRGNIRFGLKRRAESMQVLSKLGVQDEDILFIGDELAIDDATLPASLNRASAWLADWLTSFKVIKNIYVLAWEGGHHDHDALHAITLQSAEALGLLSRVRQFPLYNRYRCPGPFFRVLAPLAANGPVDSHKIPLKRRMAYIGLCLSYPTQWKTWIGLFPFVVLHYALRGDQTSQPVSLTRLAERPHEGTLYYEHRKFFDWDRMRECIGR